MKFNRVAIERKFLCGFDLLLTVGVVIAFAVAAVATLVGCSHSGRSTDSTNESIFATHSRIYTTGDRKVFLYARNRGDSWAIVQLTNAAGLEHESLVAARDFALFDLVCGEGPWEFAHVGTVELEIDSRGTHAVLVTQGQEVPAP